MAAFPVRRAARGARRLHGRRLTIEPTRSAVSSWPIRGSPTCGWSWRIPATPCACCARSTPSSRCTSPRGRARLPRLPRSAAHGRERTDAPAGGFTVVEVTEFPFPASGVQAFEEGIIEMSGPGAAYSRLRRPREPPARASRPGAASSNADYDDAVRRAALRVADALAAASR